MGCPISDGRLLNLAYDTNEHHPKKPHLCSAADSADDDRMLGRATAGIISLPDLDAFVGRKIHMAFRDAEHAIPCVG